MRAARAAALAALALAAAGLTLAGCGGGGGGGTSTSSSTGSSDANSRLPRDSSVNPGYGGGAPPVAPAVRAAAAAAGCTVKGFPFEPVAQQPDGTYHIQGNPTYKVSLPPTSGLHYPVWADWGVYDVPVAFRYQVHNLEHGGIIVHEGKSLPASARSAIVALWREAPAFMLVTPETFAQFPPKAVVITSWQRWMVCNPYTPKALAAIKVYRNTYRGTGPEGIAGLDIQGGAAQYGLPTPAIPDEGAKQ